MIHPEATRQEQFRTVFESCYPKVIAFARRRVPADDVDDIVADTFLVVWRRWDDVPSGQSTLPWVYGVARHVISQRHRSHSRWRRLRVRLAGVGPEYEPAADLVSDEDVDAALGQLRPQDRAVLALFYWEDLALAEIAEILGISANAVSIRLHRARNRFAEVWHPAADDDRRTPLDDWRDQ